MKIERRIHEIAPDDGVTSTKAVESRLLWCALVALGVGSPAFAGTEPGASSPAPDEATEASEGIVPVPDYSGDFWKRLYLSGDWGGTRQDLADQGFTFDLEWYQVGQGVVSGGLKEHWTYGSNFDYYMKFDLMRMGLVPGALVSFRGQSRFGSTINTDTGMLLPANTFSMFPLTDPLERDVPFAITELNWTQMLSEQSGLVLGKITTLASANEFAGGEGRTQFMNFQFIFASPLATIGPYSTLAAAALWMPTPLVTANLAVLNTADSSTTSGFDDFGDGHTWALTLDTQYESNGLPGGTSLLGAYAQDGDFARLGGIYLDPGGNIAFGTKSSNWSVYLNAWQYLFVEKAQPGVVDQRDGKQDHQGMGVFVMLGTADKDVNPVSWSVATGLSGRGPLAGRDDDTWGLGYFYNDVQDDNSVVLQNIRNSSQGVEGYYNIAVAKAVAFTLDAQYLKSAFPVADNSFVLGARLNLSF